MSTKTILLVAFFIALTYRPTDGIVPVELVRTVFLFQDTPRLDTPAVARAGAALAWSVFALCIYLGLPRNPRRPPIRRDVHGPPEVNWGNIDIATVATYIDRIAQMDKDGCLSRLVCYLETRPESELSFMQKIILQSIGTSSNPDPDSGWSYSPEQSARRRFVAAVEFGRRTKCASCCHNYYRSCSLDTKSLLQIF